MLEGNRTKYTELEDLLTKILELRTSGKNIEDITKEAKIMVEEDVMERIDLAILVGKKSGSDISESFYIGVTPHDSSENFEYVLRRRYNNNTYVYAIEMIKKFADEGLNFVEIALKTGYSVSTLRKYANKGKIKVRRLKIGMQGRPRRKHPEKDELIQQGLTLREIGERVGISVEGIRKYIVRTNQYDEYRKLKKTKKEEKQRKKELLRYLDFLLRKRIEQLAYKQGRAYEKAIEYLKLLKRPRKVAILFENLVGLFNRYEETVKSGKKLSLVELSELTDISISHTGNVLKTVGLEPMHGSLKRHITPKGKKEAIKRSLKLRMSSADVGYFLKIPSHVVIQNQILHGKRKYKPENFRKHSSWIAGEKDLTYRLASQIYEASDLRFKREEISELLDAQPDIVSYALQNRNEIQPKIVKELKVLYKGRKSNKPYITSSDRFE